MGSADARRGRLIHALWVKKAEPKHLTVLWEISARQAFVSRGNLDQCLLLAHSGHAFANHFMLDTKRYQMKSREFKGRRDESDVKSLK